MIKFKIVDQIGIMEVVVAEALVFTFLWWMDEYLAKLITAIFVPIFFAIFCISIISEFLDRSKVPRKFFYLLGLSILIPLFILLIAMQLLAQ